MFIIVLILILVLKGLLNMIRLLWNLFGKCESCIFILRCLSCLVNMIVLLWMRLYLVVMMYVNGNFDSFLFDVIIGKIVGVKSLFFNLLNKVLFFICLILFFICLSLVDCIYLVGRYFCWLNRNLYFFFLNFVEVCKLFWKVLNKEWFKFM